MTIDRRRPVSGRGLEGPERGTTPMLRGTSLESIVEAELIRVGPGSGPGTMPAGPGGGVALIVEGAGHALSADVWVPVAAGDRVVLGPGEPGALRATEGPIAALLLREVPGGPAREDGPGRAA